MKRKKALDGLQGGESLSPVGAVVNSPGREPWESALRPEFRGLEAPKGRQNRSAGLGFCRPFGAWKERRASTQGSRPGLLTTAPFGAQKTPPRYPARAKKKPGFSRRSRVVEAVAVDSLTTIAR